VGADQQVTMLLDRDPAAHVTINGPYSMASLLGNLRDVGADQQVIALADRAAAYVVLDDREGVSSLLDIMRAVGADQQVAALIDRLPAAGMFDLVQAYTGPRLHFGRESDSHPSESWSWDDLD
jgi:hypothetical protein